jgi:23S rRNA 5-hydroxycytidine C2501 synthase
MNGTNRLELLSPAKDLECGIAAINCGADAVYIGAPKFGARAAAGNSIEDIQKLVEYAHKFWVKVYVTINTILYDNELESVQDLIKKLYVIGVDAIIFQDMAIFKMDIPPIQLFASTQTHNYDLEKIRFWDSLGIKRIILARELLLDEIIEIKKAVLADLEFFVHGALCVCLSGQCYMSHAITGRSANRGECAQPCRMQYSLIDKDGKTIVSEKHLLSLRDLNLSAYLNDLIEAGITSFKIEGRLKDVGYVKNITAYYRQKLDSIIENNSSLKKSSSGYSIIPFKPDPEKTFNRGYTSYFIDGKDENLSSIDTPKSTGKHLGVVSKVDSRSFTVDTLETIINGDGLCFFDESGELVGMNVNSVKQNTVLTNDPRGITIGTKIFRNYDHAFNNELKQDCSRKIRAAITIEESNDGFKIKAVDEDGVNIFHIIKTSKQIADNSKRALETIKTQLSKSGETIFDVEEVVVKFSTLFFFPIKTLNDMRRAVLEKLEKERIQKHKIEKRIPRHSDLDLQETILDYKANVTNKLSSKFYEEHGAEEIEPGFELQNNFSGKTLMTCKYCIKDELGYCPEKTDTKLDEPLFLLNNNKKYRLVFNCKECRMEIKYD